MGKKTPETTPETAQKKPRGFGKIKAAVKTFKKNLKKTMLGLEPSDHEEAWNKFPEEIQKEMLESLAMKDEIDLYSIELPCTIDEDRSVLSCGFEATTFQPGTIQHDNFGNYIIIDWKKCREWEPGISGFTYKDIQTKYNPDRRLKIGFCDKGYFEKSITLNDCGKQTAMDPEKIKSKKTLIEKEDLDFLCSINLNSLITNDEATQGFEGYKLSESVIQTDENGKYIMINGKKCRKWEPGISGLAYREYDQTKHDHDNVVIIGFCKNGKYIAKITINNLGEPTHITRDTEDNGTASAWFNTGKLEHLSRKPNKEEQ